MISLKRNSQNPKAATTRVGAGPRCERGALSGASASATSTLALTGIPAFDALVRARPSPRPRPNPHDPFARHVVDTPPPHRRAQRRPATRYAISVKSRGSPQRTTPKFPTDYALVPTP